MNTNLVNITLQNPSRLYFVIVLYHCTATTKNGVEKNGER